MKVEVVCCVCGTKVFREKGEVNRNAKLGRKVYCSLRCVGLDTLDNIPKDKRYHPENLRGPATDDLSKFRFHLKNIRLHYAQSKKASKVCEVTLEDLKEQWEKQSGKCPYTGWELKTPINTSQAHQLAKTPDRASVDRIDSSKPYTKDNIQFVSMMAQFAKNGWSDTEVENFCRAVAKHRSL